MNKFFIKLIIKSNKISNLYANQLKLSEKS